MKTIIASPKKSQVKLTIELSDDDLARFREKAAQSLSKRVKVPGYREGKAPSFVVETQVGKEVFSQEVLRHALPETFAEAIREHKVAAIARPKITVISEYPLKYEAEVALMPEVTIKGHDKVKIKREETEVSDKELEEVLNEMRKYHATYEERKDGVKKADRVEIDFTGFDEKGAIIENTQSKSHPLFVGEGTLIPGFEDQLLDMKTGEKKTFDITFPKDFRSESLRGKKVKFEVDLKKAEVPILPEVSEEFIEKLTGEKKTVPEFHSQVKEDIKRQKASAIRRKQENELLEAWLKLGKMELPEILIEEETDYLLEELAADLQNRGLKLEQYEQFLNSKNRDLKKEKREEAVSRLKIRLILQHIFKIEGLAVTPEEIEREIELMLLQTPDGERQKTREMLKGDRGRMLQIENSIKLRKLFDKYLAKQ